MTQGIHIRQFLVDEWQALKDIRLESLQTNQQFFSAALDEERAKGEDFWRNATSHAGAAFALLDADKIVGLTGIYHDWKGRDGVAILCMSYIRQEYRGKGLADLLYKARIDWAKAQGNIHTLLVGYREGNNASEAVIKRWGFVPIRVDDDHLYGNGDKAKTYIYELKI